MSSLADFISRWRASGGSEQANAQLFLAEFCDLLDLPRPEPARALNEENSYSFERKVFVPRGDGTSELKRLDLYRKGCFVLESKQGQDGKDSLRLSGLSASSAVKRGTRQWEDAMQRARRQAEHYIHCLPAAEGRPPFLLVADVGHCFDLYAEFSRTGGLYLPFPDAACSRIRLEDLQKPEVQELFRTIWNDPLALDPALRAARVTEAVAAKLAELARLLEAEGHAPEKTAQFLMRCIFSMFAEDVSLIPKGSFSEILQKALLQPVLYAYSLRDLWRAMNSGSVSVGLGRRLLRFNGNIFANPEILPLSQEQIAILLEAARADWREVEPAIFGTLLERALDPKERHKLGAHYTPRAYVERLVLPTLVQPLRSEWDAVQAAAALHFSQGREAEARSAIAAFHKRHLKIRVLDPACGSGNFLYVCLEHLKRLEGEVLQSLSSYGDKSQSLLQVDPQQFLGLEINPRAAHIAEMVLWIGYMQWHFRTQGNVSPPEPIIKKFGNIQNRDALLAWKSRKYATDKDGRPQTRWDGETFKADPATGHQVPDPDAIVMDFVYEGVEAAEWPRADFIVGNPPFIGGGLKRGVLGPGYFAALKQCYPGLPEACDFVMYWWHKAAELTRQGKVRRFGLITTNSLSQVFNRRVVDAQLKALPPLHLTFAIPDHPWVDAKDGADVRIALSVGETGAGEGILARVTEEERAPGPERAVSLRESLGIIHADLSQGVDVSGAQALAGNAGICSRGMALHGAGFIVTPQEAVSLGLGRIPGLERHIRPYRHGRDLAAVPRGLMVIDLFGLGIEEVRERYPEVWQWLFTRVKPEREAKASGSRDSAEYAAKWWLFGKPRENLRPALAGLERYIATVETSKHRYFVFLDAAIIPDNKLVNIASADAWHLGVLSSRIHLCWALAAGAGLGVTPVYVKTTCFDPFPFPEASSEQQERIRALGEKLDQLRKARQALYPKLTLTGIYNVLEALRTGRQLDEKEKAVHEQGLVSVLAQLHEELDAAVAEAYGWPSDLPEAEILARLCALNQERSAEEKTGRIRYLRPEYQDKTAQARLELALPGAQGPVTPGQVKARGKKSAPKAKRPWPGELLAQTQAVQELLAGQGQASAESIAAHFVRAPRKRIQEILEALASLGLIRLFADGK